MVDVNSQLVRTGKYLLDHALAWGNSGNMSARYDEEQMIMTASGTKIGELSIDDFATVTIDSGKWTGDKKPSKEIPMHRAIYMNRPDAQVILHASPFWSTMLACSDKLIESKLFVESMYYLKDIQAVEYFHPGSAELGEGVGKAAVKANVIILKNHGVIVFDDSIEEAKMRIETLEFTSKMLVMSEASNIPLKLLGEGRVKDFLENSGYK